MRQLRGRRRKAAIGGLRDLRDRGCMAAGYRLAGAVLDHICSRHLSGDDRMLIAWPGDDHAIAIVIGRHDRSSDDVYDVLLDTLGSKRSRPRERSRPVANTKAVRPPIPTLRATSSTPSSATVGHGAAVADFYRDIEYGPHYPDADVIIGGPPCQGFSPLGRDRDDASRARLNGLWKHYLDAVRTVRPRAFVIENVPEFQRSAQFVELLHLLATDTELSAFEVSYGVLNAADYGVPQSRRRGILVAVRDHDGPLPWPPPPTHGPASDIGNPYVTVRDAIGDLPTRTRGTDPVSDDGGQHLHFGRRPLATSMERYRAIPPGGNRFDLMRNRPDITPSCWLNKPTGTTDVMGRLWWDRPAATIRTEFFKPEKGRYLHPTANRVISHREAARLQSFPDWYGFEGTKIQIARQIGNAVPPLLGKAIADYVFDRAFAGVQPG